MDREVVGADVVSHKGLPLREGISSGLFHRSRLGACRFDAKLSQQRKFRGTGHQPGP
jgi:hypothetical protein